MKSPDLDFVTIGSILGPWGTEGKLKIKIETDFPQRFTPDSKVYVNRQLLTIASTEWHKGKLVIKLDSIDTVEDAQKLLGQSVEIHHTQVPPLPEGRYYHFQIIGLEVRTTKGELLGNVTDILSAKSNDNYVVHGVQGEILIPAIEDVVKSIDLKKECIIVEAIEGLLDLNRKNRQ